MAINFVLKLVAEGSDVTGESQDGKYPGWIDVMAYEFSGQNATSVQGGAPRISGGTTMGLFILRKLADRASPLIFKALTNRDRCKATLVLRKSGGEMEDYMRIILDGARVVKFIQGNIASGTETPEEEVHLSYDSVTMVYDVQDQKTGITRGGIEHTWEFSRAG
jgi:type VI secretion system Hcp family effector